MGFITDTLILLLLGGLSFATIYFSWKKFWFLILINIVVSVLLTVASGMFGYRPSIVQILVMLLLLVESILVVFNFITIFHFWERYTVLALLPLFISISGFWLQDITGDKGREIRMEVFNERLYLYEQAVAELAPMIKDEPLHLHYDQIPEKYRHLAYWIIGKKEKGIVFAFFWGSGFPCKHSAFVYRSDGRLPERGTDFRRDWPFCERINEHWFRVSD